MKVLILTKEYPPHTYGGAGVHVDYLSRELAKLIPVEVRCFGEQDFQLGNLRVKGVQLSREEFGAPKPLHSVFDAAYRCLDTNASGIDADVVHCHTWYTHLGGIVAKLNYGTPLVITTHSLEPFRPWKREQLAGGYDFSCWVERMALEMADAIISVSQGTKKDVLRHFNVQEERVHVIHNGIDNAEYHQQKSTQALTQFGIDVSKPYLLFVGRITRQKGIVYLVQAIKYLDPGFQVVLCAGAPDTPAIAAEMKSVVEEVSAHREGVIWIQEMVDKKSVIELYSHAAVFCCPSIYEPFGLINLEAMACETPVVASAVGGIPEVVENEGTGLLVPVDQLEESPFTPKNPDQFAQDLAEAINRLMADPRLRKRMAKAGRRRAEELFSWGVIAEQTRALYERLM